MWTLNSLLGISALALVVSTSADSFGCGGGNPYAPNDSGEVEIEGACGVHTGQQRVLSQDYVMKVSSKVVSARDEGEVGNYYTDLGDKKYEQVTEKQVKKKKVRGLR